MSSSQDQDHFPGGLSLEEVEALLLSKRQVQTERKVRIFAETERTQQDRRVPSPLDDQFAEPVCSPESWRGRDGQGRAFRSLELTSIGVSASSGAALGRVGGIGAPAQRGDGWDRVEATMPIGGVSPPEHTLRDRLLLAAELLALTAFVLILGSSYLRLRDLNREVRDAQTGALSTDSEMVLLPSLASVDAADGEGQAGSSETVLDMPDSESTTVAVLPGGHMPPRAGSVPPHLSGLVRSSVSLSRPPTPGPNAPRRLVIPSLGVDGPVVTGDSPEDLKKGIGHRLGSANPGEPSNMVVSAHNDIYGELFRDLAKLEPGDEVLVYTDKVAFRYVVNRVEIVAPTKVEVMGPTDPETFLIWGMLKKKKRGGHLQGSVVV